MCWNEFLVLNDVFAEEDICFKLHLNEESPSAKMRKAQRDSGEHSVRSHDFDPLL